MANSKKLSFSKSPILKKLTEIAQQLQKLSKYANTAEAVQIQQLHTLGQLQLHSTAMMNNKHMGLEGRFGSNSQPTSITSKTALPNNLKISLQSLHFFQGLISSINLWWASKLIQFFLSDVCDCIHYGNTGCEEFKIKLISYPSSEFFTTVIAIGYVQLCSY